MIVGNGLIATAFKESNINHDDYIIFASGVSNSNETNIKEFIREEKLLVNILIQNSNKKIIYFDSILSETKLNVYYIHKCRMVDMIKFSKKDYIIYKIPQLIGRNGNKNNLIQTLKNNIINDKEITVYNGIYRAILDVDDLVSFVNYSMNKANKKPINISYIEKISIIELVNMMAKILTKNSTFKFVDNNGKNWYTGNSIITLEWILINDIKMKGYTEKVLRKYL